MQDLLTMPTSGREEKINNHHKVDISQLGISNLDILLERALYAFVR
jgi:hypothetical protein